MFLFFVKNNITKSTALALLLMAGALFVSCEQPGGKPVVNAANPNISTQPQGGTWDAARPFELKVTASVTDGGQPSYQWYFNKDNRNTGGAAIAGETNATLTLDDEKDYVNGTFFFYVVVTNTNNNVSGSKTASTTSDAARVNITGVDSIYPYANIWTAEDMAKIGIDDDYPLSGTYFLMSDIELANWTPIGGAEPFTGVFNGNGKTITVTNFSRPVGSIIPKNPESGAAGAQLDDVFMGIFAWVEGAAIGDLKIHSSVDYAKTAANGEAGIGFGLAAGFAKNSVFENITLSGNLNFDFDRTLYVGGVVGFSWETLVKNCNSSMTLYVKPGNGGPLGIGNANAFSFIGGFVGHFVANSGIENCRNSGDVSGLGFGRSGAQVMAGGVAGGSFYAFASNPQGYINNCSSAGDITVSAAGFWPMAGGIVGLISGTKDGTKENSTRVERSWATGTVKAADLPGNNWPYIGGIAGYIYVGAWVSQCWFDGAVICDKANDYSGGIAGYSSNATTRNYPCVIEDCWSAGQVAGYNNAGGIVGQNQQYANLKRSYSLMDVSIINGGTSNAAQWGAGGIAGSHSDTCFENSLEACVALNARISSPAVKPAIAGTAAQNNETHRITGRLQAVAGAAPTMNDNYALPGLAVQTDNTFVESKGINQADGEDIPAGYLADGKPTQAFYEFIGWDFDHVWKMGGDGYPQLQWQN